MMERALKLNQRKSKILKTYTDIYCVTIFMKILILKITKGLIVLIVTYNYSASINEYFLK